MPFAEVYPHYLAKVERKGKQPQNVDIVIEWLTGYTKSQIAQAVADRRTFTQFFADAPAINPNAHLITGVICGVRIEALADPLMQQIRWMDKLVDEVAKGKKLEKIMRQPTGIR